MIIVTANRADERDTLIVVAGIIKNPLGPASAITNWRMELGLPDGTVVQGMPPLLPKGEITFESESGRGIILHTDHFWSRTSRDPIPAGGMSDGWFWAIFRGVSREQAKEGRLTISFEDVVTDTRHSITTAAEKSQRFIDPHGMELG